MRGAVRLLLGPVLLWQGRRVRQNILRMPEPDGPREGVTGDGPECSILILGDSAAAGVGAATQDDALTGRLIARLAETHTVRWRLVAKTGWTTADAIGALAAVQGQRFDAVVLSVGVNDVTTETGLTRWLGLYADLIDRLKWEHDARIVIANQMPPMARFPALPQPLRWYLGLQANAHDAALAKLADRTSDCARISMDMAQFKATDGAEDGFHPGPPIYDAWAAQAADIILDRLRSEEACA